MSSVVRDAIRRQTAGLVKREVLTLPECGVAVQVRGLMAGEAHRAGEAKGFRQTATMIALGVEDPETGKPFWNVNVLEDVTEIEAMHPVDVAALVMKINELSGVGKMQALLSDQSKNGDSSSPESSNAPSGS